MKYLIIILLIFLVALSPTLIKHFKEKKGILKEINNFFDELEKYDDEYISFRIKEKIKKKYEKYKGYGYINSDYLSFLDIIKNFDDYCKKHNKEYVERNLIKNKKYFDELLKYPLDTEQRKAVLVDEDSNLIIAGAGTGKTSTMVAKIKFLIEKKKVNPEDILAITFTRSAALNLAQRVESNIDSITFHKLGLSILSKSSLNKISVNTDLLEKTVRSYFFSDIFDDKKMLENLINILTVYVYIPFSKGEANLGDIIDVERGFNFRTIKEMVIFKKILDSLEKGDDEYKYLFKDKEIYNELVKKIKKDKKLTKEDLKSYINTNKLTIKGDKVKSIEELMISNYLFLNKIDYLYEEPYKFDVSSENYRQYKPDFYFPEKDFYLEHWGLDENGKTPQYSKIEEKKYLDRVDWARNIHKKYKTKLEETYSYYFKKNIILDELDKILESNNLTLNKKLSEKELLEIIKAIQEYELKDYDELIKLVIKFIEMFKSNNYKYSDFDKFIKLAKEENNQRSVLLLELIKNVFYKYQTELSSKQQIDFSDMINMAAEQVEKGIYKPKYKYIIVDEYQDIAYSRYRLLKSIVDKCDCKVVAVGDDWQSIFRFTGCDLNMFINFKKYFPNSEILFINNTYRNSQELIDVVGKFIIKNPNQVEKKLKSKVSEEKPFIYVYYSDLLEGTKFAIDILKKENCKKIAILGRNKDDISAYTSKDSRNIEMPFDLSEVFGTNVEYTTIHKSKGLEYDGVIVCSMINKLNGFPNKMSDDPVLKYVTKTEENYLYEEERRLLYVASTRTKSKTIFMIPYYNESSFVNELYLIDKEKFEICRTGVDPYEHNPSCPKCIKGKLVIRKNKLNNSEFVSCTNYPKCDFHTNSIDVVNHPIKCDLCEGYMVKRSGHNNEFYGCTNYPYCRNIMNIYNDEKKSF